MMTRRGDDLYSKCTKKQTKYTIGLLFADENNESMTFRIAALRSSCMTEKVKRGSYLTFPTGFILDTRMSKLDPFLSTLSSCSVSFVPWEAIPAKS